jgi:hypothetical protein
MAMLGLVGGPLVCASGLAVVFDIIGRASAAQSIATIPEFFWELSLGIYLTVKGFKPSPLLDETRYTGAEEAPSIRRWLRGNCQQLDDRN